MEHLKQESRATKHSRVLEHSRADFTRSKAHSLRRHCTGIFFVGAVEQAIAGAYDRVEAAVPSFSGAASVTPSQRVGVVGAQQLPIWTRPVRDVSGLRVDATTLVVAAVRMGFSCMMESSAFPSATATRPSKYRLIWVSWNKYRAWLRG